ncbi:MOB member 4, phocein [Lobulomyces angularis]|nr:MOB member 4, phocein [Lobulomyces angularis]
MATTVQRNHIGTKMEEWCLNWPTDLSSQSSSFAIFQFIQAQIRLDKNNLQAICTPPQNQDLLCWQYEHFRQFCNQLNFLICLLVSECNKETCPEMKAGEYLYLCAAHTPPKQCCAIDYIVHTIDSTTQLLHNSIKFPSRISIPASSGKHFQDMARRLYRIFSHTWFQHKEIFEEFEAETSLYTRFIFFCTTTFKLIPEQMIVIRQNDSEYITYQTEELPSNLNARPPQDKKKNVMLFDGGIRKKDDEEEEEDDDEIDEDAYEVSANEDDLEEKTVITLKENNF